MTREAGLPDRVQAFVARYLDSVAELEALLLVRSVQQAWQVPDIAARLYITEAEAGAVLKALRRRGLLARDGEAYRFAPGAALGADVEALADAYPRFLIPITALIHGKPRTSLRDFADAFRLRDDT